MADGNPEVRLPAPAGRTQHCFRWLVLSALFLTAWTLICAHAPGRIKLIGLFAVGYGLAAGWVLKQLAQMSALSNSRLLTALTLLLVAVGQIGLALESHRLYVVEARRVLESDKNGAALALLLRNNTPTADPKSREMIDDMRRSLGLHAEFRSYLTHRVTQFGVRKSPWPEIFWISEVLAGGAAAAWIMSRPSNVRQMPLQLQEND